MVQPFESVAPALPTSLSDREVIERIRGGESRLFELLVRRYNQRVYRMARSLVRDEQEAEDVMQEAYVRAYTHLDQYRAEASFATWLTRIAVHEAYARLRRQRRSLGFEEAAEGAAQRGETWMHTTRTPEDCAGNRQLGELLTEVVDALPEPLRLVFVLREVEGLSTAAAAECLGLSEANVKVRLHRARAVLRREIDQRLGSELEAVYDFHLRRCDRVVEGVFRRLGL